MQVVTICHIHVTLHFIITTALQDLYITASWWKSFSQVSPMRENMQRLMRKCGKTKATCKQNRIHLSQFNVCIFWSLQSRPLISLCIHRAHFDSCRKKWSPTIDQDCGRVALAASDDVFGHTCVVPRVCQAGFFDDEIMVGSDEKIGVAHWVDHIFVSLPLHLKICFSGQNFAACQQKLFPCPVELFSNQTCCRWDGFTVNEKKAVQVFFLCSQTYKKRSKCSLVWYKYWDGIG